MPSRSSLDDFWDDDVKKAGGGFWDDVDEEPTPRKSPPSPRKSSPPTPEVHRKFKFADGSICHVYHPQQHPDQPLQFIHDFRPKSERFHE